MADQDDPSGPREPLPLPPGTALLGAGSVHKGSLPIELPMDEPAAVLLAPEGYVRPVWEEPSRAGLAFLLALAGFMACGIPAVASLWVAAREIRRIDDGLRDPRSRSLARGAQVVAGLEVLLFGVLWLFVLLGGFAHASP